MECLVPRVALVKCETIVEERDLIQDVLKHARYSSEHVYTEDLVNRPNLS